jgi:hypothetical protein
MKKSAASNFDLSLQDAIELALIRTNKVESGLSLSDFSFLLLKKQPKRAHLKKKKKMYAAWRRNPLIVNLNNEWIYPFRTYKYQKPGLYKILKKMSDEKEGTPRLKKKIIKGEPRYQIPKERLTIVSNKFKSILLNKDAIYSGLPSISEDVSLYNYNFEMLFDLANSYYVDIHSVQKEYNETLQEFKKLEEKLGEVYSKLISEITNSIYYCLLTSKNIKKLDKELAIIFIAYSFETYKEDIMGMLLFFSFSGSPIGKKWFKPEVFEWNKDMEKTICKINPDKKIIDDFKTHFYPQKSKQDIKKMLHGYIVGKEASIMMWQSKVLSILPLFLSGQVVIQSNSLLDQLQKKSVSEENLKLLEDLSNRKKKLFFERVDLCDILPGINDINDDINSDIKYLINFAKRN